jgi:thiamine-monophosphate kinase
MAQLGEFGLISRLAAQTAQIKQPKHVILGMGDDAAILAVPDGRAVVSIDLLVEGRHFRRDWATAIDIGRRAAAASLADIAAMGATATGLVVGLAMPGDLPAHWAVELHAGLQEEASRVGAAIVGGDVTSADQIMIAVTAIGDLGEVPPVQRSGAKPGDVLAVAGRLGFAAAGLAVLSRGFRAPRELVDAYRAPEPPYAAGPAAARAGATAMIDISDGLIADARHIARASGVDVDIEVDRLKIPGVLQEIASAYNVDPLEWMLTGGDDHALLATFPKDAKRPRAFTVLGSVRESSDPAVRVNGAAVQVAGGFEHFTRG